MQCLIRKEERGKYKKLFILLSIALLSTLAGYSWKWAKAYSITDGSVQLEKLRIAEVTRGDLVKDISVNGRVVAAIRPTLFSPSNGSVELKVRAGDSVDENQLIAVIHSPQLQSQLEQEKATLQSLELEVSRQRISNKLEKLGFQQQVDVTSVRRDATRRELKRAQLSIADQVISVIDYEKAKDDLKTAEMEFNHAETEAQLQSERLDFELKVKALQLERQRVLFNELQRRTQQLQIYSPVTGKIGDLLVEQKASVTENQPLLSVVDLSGLEVEVSIPESYADDLRSGMDAEISYNNQLFAGSISAISPEVKNNSVTGTIRFSQDIPVGLRQNQQLTTRIMIESKEGILKVKRGAFLQSGSGRLTYLVTNDIAKRHPIQVGSIGISEVEIISGLNEGDQVVISDLSIMGNSPMMRLTQ
ncbi:HlyD family efflux transporter periplasmic adaptor subunit [Alteromonadaceae bacterium M269]|nr:HlyD family efflux transporter periplasmic adaptor subunit [Alteromonadaceae bacterium M269]